MVRALLLIVSLYPPLYGQVTLSELMSNEPSGRVRLEWIEIYNRSITEVDLNHYMLIANDDTSFFDPGTIIEGGKYAIVARQPLPENGSDSFEGFWGDSSGVWGDDPAENYLLLDGAFTLSNNSGSVSVIDTGGIVLDQFNWNSPSDDGRSEEKDDVSRDFTAWHACFNPQGSTPGRVNSIIPQGGGDSFEADISPKVTSAGATHGDPFHVTVVVPVGAKLSIDVYDDSGAKRVSLAENNQDPVFEADWNGVDNSGKALSPGIYIIGLSLSGQKAEHKFIPVVIAP